MEKNLFFGVSILVNIILICGLCWVISTIPKSETSVQTYLFPVPQEWLEKDSLKQWKHQTMPDNLDQLIVLEHNAEIVRLNDINKQIDKKIDLQARSTNTSMLIAVIVGLLGIWGGYRTVRTEAQSFALGEIQSEVKRQFRETFMKKKIRKMVEENPAAFAESLTLANLEKQEIENAVIGLIHDPKEKDHAKELKAFLKKFQFNEEYIHLYPFQKGQAYSAIESQHKGRDYSEKFSACLFYHGLDKKSSEASLEVGEFINSIPASIPVLYVGGGQIRNLSGGRLKLWNAASMIANVYPNLLELLRMKSYLDRE